jgi:hypothetical protein
VALRALWRSASQRRDAPVASRVVGQAGGPGLDVGEAGDRVDRHGAPAAAGKRPDPAGNPQRLSGVGEIQARDRGDLEAADLGPTMTAVVGGVGDGDRTSSVWPRIPPVVWSSAASRWTCGPAGWGGRQAPVNGSRQVPSAAAAWAVAGMGDDGRGGTAVRSGHGIGHPHDRQELCLPLTVEPARPTVTNQTSRRLDAALPGPGLRRRSSPNWVEFEDASALGGFHRIVEIDTIGDANEPDTERYASRVRTEDVAKEGNALCRVQLGRAHFFLPAARRDGRATGSAEIAHPLDLAPGSPDPTPAYYLDDRQRRGARQAALAATNGDEPIGTYRHAGDQKELQDSAEEPDPPWPTCRLRHRDPLNSIAHLRSSLAAVLCAPADNLRRMRRWPGRVLGHSFADQVGALPPTVALAQSWVLAASAHLRLGSAGVVWYLLPARIAREGVGNVTVCTNARTGLSLESGSRPGPTRLRGVGPRQGHRTHADESRPCRGPGVGPFRSPGTVGRGIRAPCTRPALRFPCRVGASTLPARGPCEVSSPCSGWRGIRGYLV